MNKRKLLVLLTVGLLVCPVLWLFLSLAGGKTDAGKYRSLQRLYNLGFHARCAELSGNSFRSTREYFAHEANREFLTEAAVFGAIMLSIAVPLFNGILAIVDLIRSGGAA